MTSTRYFLLTDKQKKQEICRVHCVNTICKILLHQHLTGYVTYYKYLHNLYNIPRSLKHVIGCTIVGGKKMYKPSSTANTRNALI